MTHRRRRAKHVPLEIRITGNAQFVRNKDIVLSSDANKTDQIDWWQIG